MVRRRHMVRRFDPDRPVDPALVDRMLEHATRAPSAGNSQGWAFLRLDEARDVDRFWVATSPDPEATNRWLAGMRTAPVVLVPLADEAAYRARYAEPDKAGPHRAGPGGAAERWAVPYWYLDLGMASLLVLQTAVDEGLGACFFGVPGERWAALREAFGVPARLVPVGAIAVGHRVPGDPGSHGSAARSRRPLSEVVHRGRWRRSGEAGPS